ncbi:threonine/serine exporter family protein [uncultured Flavonifractor sp.]|uniref:Threonine/serine exporter family protein n=1 Tax=Candidatus Flavonifractor intestinigallinarum TaxID=2838586 RepID=A0A9D2SBE2_9FIRM|nr:threonine/serine exporter family protein [uncultured Flavonifractor sp.]HJB80496.1 threonine/serine exporter family protein [Candidatus Flavonifractor intestinigallinarum]
MEQFTYYLPCIYAFLACIGFSLLFNIHGAAGMLICAGGGALGWLVYLLAAPLVHSDIIQSFFAALAISAWSEIMARLRRCPVTSYLLVALFPLVPGGGIYYTMEHAMSGETSLFLESLLHTLGLAGALAVGVLMVASLARLVTNYQNHRRSLPGGKHP